MSSVFSRAGVLSAALLALPLSATAQVVSEIGAPTVATTYIDMDAAGPVGATSVAAINAAGVPSPAAIANIVLTPSSAANPGVYNTNVTCNRALGLGYQTGNALELLDAPAGQFTSFNARIDLGGPSTEFGVGIGDWVGPMIMDFYLGSVLQTTYTSSTYTTCDRKIFQMTGGTFDRIDLQASTSAGNWVITELTIQLLSGLFASFTATPTSGASPLAVQFTDRTFTSDPGGVRTWAWDFDNNGTIDSTQRNPSTTYTRCGKYSVRLTVTDSMHPASTVTRTDYIVVDPILLPRADFTATPTGGLTFQFTDTSTGTPTSWEWDFDNNGTIDSTARNPVHTYPVSGQYTARLTARNACGADTIRKSVLTNDECGGAITVVDGLNGPFSNVGSTTSFPWPCAAGGNDVWFRYTASCNGNLTFDTCTGTNYDSSIEIFDTSTGCTSPFSLVCNDDSCGLQSSATISNVTMGTAFLIRIGGYNSATGTFSLRIRCAPPAGNDECAQAVALVAGPNGPFDNLTATTSAPPWPCALGANDVWFSFTTNCPGTYQFDTCGSTFDTALEVFSAGPAGCGNLQPVQCNDDACGLQSIVTATLTAGTRYYVRVGGYNGARGTFGLNVGRAGGTGTVTSVIPGCGGLRVVTTGAPNIGTNITHSLSSVQGVGFLWLGLNQLGVPLCTSCQLGTEFTVIINAATSGGQIPCFAGLVGGVYYVQGADINSMAPGGCTAGNPFAFPFTMTDTVRVTVGM